MLNMINAIIRCMVEETKRIPVSPKIKKRVDIAKAKSDCGTYDKFLSHLVDLEEGKLSLEIDSEKLSEYMKKTLRDFEKGYRTEEEIIIFLRDAIPSFVKPVTETR